MIQDSIKENAIKKDVKLSLLSNIIKNRCNASVTHFICNAIDHLIAIGWPPRPISHFSSLCLDSLKVPLGKLMDVKRTESYTLGPIASAPYLLLIFILPHALSITIIDCFLKQKRFGK